MLTLRIYNIKIVKQNMVFNILNDNNRNSIVLMSTLCQNYNEKRTAIITLILLFLLFVV